MPHLKRHLIAFLILLLPVPVLAEMSSNNYRVQTDSFSCGGGRSTSNNYILFDTLCDTAAGDMTSSSYVASGGFQAAQDLPFITQTLSGTSVAFGTLATNSVATGTITVTISTNSWAGYSTTIVTDGDFRTSGGAAMTNAGTNDTISAGSGKYGIATSGSHAALTGDNGISSTAKTIASSSGPADEVVTTVTFKAAASATTVAGSYSQTITIITTGTF